VPVIGSVPYANARPLLEGLDGERDVRLVLEPPSRLAERLAAGELDVALVPSVDALRNPGRPVVPAGCISSRGPVRSVSLFCRGPLRPGARVLVDESSLTSATMVRLLLAGPLGVPGASFARCPPGTDPRRADADAVLLIGDAALALERRGLREIDLGAAWTEWTGLPAVWAVWAARDEASARSLEPILRRARALGAERLPGIVRREAVRLGVGAEAMERYLTRHILYEFGEEERRGLARLGEECRRAGLLPVAQG
jgi:chorismate dehydratase